MTLLRCSKQYNNGTKRKTARFQWFSAKDSVQFFIQIELAEMTAFCSCLAVITESRIFTATSNHVTAEQNKKLHGFIGFLPKIPCSFFIHIELAEMTVFCSCLTPITEF